MITTILSKACPGSRAVTATKVTPFFADMGRHPYKGTQPKPVYQSNVQLAQDFANSLTKV